MADNGNGGPWWAQLLKTVGPVAAIAVYLVYFQTVQLTPVLQNMNTFMASHTQQMNDLIVDERDDAAQRARQWQVIAQVQTAEHKDKEATLQLEQQTCINTAKSPFQSEKCLEVRNAGEASVVP